MVTCNGVPLVPAEALTLQQQKSGSEQDEEPEYMYDVYLYNPEEDEELVLEASYREVNDEEVSSNDEEHPNNDYPDEDPEEAGEDEGDEYRPWEDDEYREMFRDFERNRIRDDDSEPGSDDENLYARGRYYGYDDDDEEERYGGDEHDY